MVRRLERLLELDSLLRSSQRFTADSLAAQLERSERTIREDLAFMRDRYGAPIIFSPKHGWHYTDPDWRLPTIMLNEGELFALTLGARMLEAYAGSVYALQLRSAIARLAERLPEQTWVDLQQVADERIQFRSGATVDLNPEIWQHLAQACRRQLSVQMKYYTASRNTISERQFDPYLLHLYRGTNPYAIGYCHQRQDIRWFRVDRIQQLTVLDETFVPNPQFNAKTYLDQIFQHEAGGELQSVVIWFDASTAPYIRERQWHPTQKIEELVDGSVILRMTVRGINDLKRWVMGYGKGAIVREPPELVEMIKDEILTMNQYY